ncbi:hypothetical protein HMPREF0731_4359, partial [Pseudoroseomonas cervicalis ATCC 49957]
MKRIQDPSAAAALPALPSLSGPTGYFTEGDPVGGVLATRVPAWWLNGVQEELAGVIEAAGFMPLANSNTQLLSAVRRIAQLQFAVLTSSGAVTVPLGKTQCLVLAWAGGGGGGGSNGSVSGGSGGGAGEFRAGLLTGLTPGATINATVGGGG